MKIKNKKIIDKKSFLSRKQINRLVECLNKYFYYKIYEHKEKKRYKYLIYIFIKKRKKLSFKEINNGLNKLFISYKQDIKLCYLNDPSLIDEKEVFFSHNGFKAIFIYRFANLLSKYNISFLPRQISEYAHSVTGIDIHPFSSIGCPFFIDHGTGIVIGETSIIGNSVSLYQGVTLGAFSLKDGRELSGKKRHPTIEDNVVIYANATILGGNTIIGSNSIIGAYAFISNSIEANSIVKKNNH